MESFNLKGNQTMKTTFRLIGAVATVAALFSSCKKEAFNEEVKPGTVEMTIIAGADDVTRTVLGSDGAVTWATSGEQLAVIEVAVSGTTTTTAKETSKVGVTNDEGATMSFGVSMTAKTADSFEYYALYPNSAYVEKPTDLAKVKVNLASTQAPTESSFGPSADVLVAKPETGLSAQPTELNLQFARVIAVGKMTIKDLNTSENVKKVTFTAAGKAVTGKSYINFKTAAGVEYGYSSYGEDNVVLDYSNKTIAANGMIAYFTCWPFELAVGETFSVVVETENYIFTKDVTLTEGKSLAFKVGSASAFSVSFTGIDGVEKAPATQLVPDGEYVVAYNNNMMTVGTTSNKYRDYAALPEESNADGSYSVDATAAWNFVYNSENETYSIQSVSESKYLNWTSSTSLTLDSTTPTNYSITKNEDGTYKIGSTSNSDTRYIGYNNTNPRFAMYLSRQKDQIINLNLYPAKVVKLAEISVQETLSLSAELAEGEIPVSWKNVDMSYVAVDVYKDADCTIKEKSWITVEFNTEKTAIVYTVNSNDTETARTAYIKVEAVSTDGESEDSKIIIVTQAAASTGGETSWTRVTTVAELLAGGTFIIGYEATANSGKIVPMANTGSATTSAAGFIYSGSTATSGGNGTIDMSTVSETSNYEVTIVASTSVSGAICIKLGDNYLGNTNTKNKCKLFTADAATTAFTPTVGGNDVFTLKIAANQTYHTLQYNTGSPRFAVYNGAQKNVVIYKKGN